MEIVPAGGAPGPQFEQAGGRGQRTKVYKLLNLFRSFAELSARVEAVVFEARTLTACKASAIPRVVTELPEAEQRHLEVERVKRTLDLLQKSGLAMVKAIMQHKFAYVFNQPVDTNAYPNYLQTVQHPMDLGTIKERLEAGNHFKELKEVWSDVCLVFHNARLFNPPGSDVHIMAQTMQEYAEEKWEKGVTPKLVEEQQAAAKEEAHAKRRYAETLSKADAAAMEHQALQLVSVMEELNTSISEVKSQAGALCEGLNQAELDQLGAAVKALPAKQLQAAVQLVAARNSANLQPTTLGGMPELPGVNVRKVVLELESYEPITLRLLQLLVKQAAAAAVPPAPSATPDATTQDHAAGGVQGDTGAEAVHMEVDAAGAAAGAGGAGVAATQAGEAAGGGDAVMLSGDAPASATAAAAAGSGGAEPKTSGADKLSAGALSSPFASAWSQEGPGAGLARGASVQGPMAGTASGVLPAGLLEDGGFPDVGHLRSIPDFLMTQQVAGSQGPAAGGMAGVCSQAGITWPLVALGAGRRATGRVSVRTGEEQLAHQRRERYRHQQVYASHLQHRQRRQASHQGHGSRMRHQTSVNPPPDMSYSTPLPASHHMSSTAHLPSYPAPPILPPPQAPALLQLLPSHH